MDFQEYNTLNNEILHEVEKQKRPKRNLLMLVPCLILAFLLIGLGIYLYFSFTLPPIKSLEDYKPPIITKVFSDDGELVGEFSNERRIVVPIDQIPEVLSLAFVAAEDANFFRHKGIAYLSILRAMIRKVSHQGRDTLCLSKPDLSGTRKLRCGGGLPRLLRQGGRGDHPP
jgi:penicillin-binding protein 1A